MVGTLHEDLLYHCAFNDSFATYASKSKPDGYRLQEITSSLPPPHHHYPYYNIILAWSFWLRDFYEDKENGIQPRIRAQAFVLATFFTRAHHKEGVCLLACKDWWRAST